MFILNVKTLRELVKNRLLEVKNAIRVRVRVKINQEKEVKNTVECQIENTGYIDEPM